LSFLLKNLKHVGKKSDARIKKSDARIKKSDTRIKA
jgi:hypothetical protein